MQQAVPVVDGVIDAPNYTWQNMLGDAAPYAGAGIAATGGIIGGASGIEELLDDDPSVVTSNTEVWTPCYKNEQAQAVGLPNRDALAAAWCQRRGGELATGAGSWRDCGDWKYSLICR